MHLDLPLPEWWENTFLLLTPPSLVLCYGSPSRLIRHGTILQVLPTKSEPLRSPRKPKPSPISSGPCVSCTSGTTSLSPVSPAPALREQGLACHAEPRGVAQSHQSHLSPPLPEPTGASLATPLWPPSLNQFAPLSAQPPWASLTWNFALALALALLLVTVFVSLLLSCSADHVTGVSHAQNSSVNLRYPPPSEFTTFQNHSMSSRKLSH